MKKSIMQAKKECYITGAVDDLQRHHIYHGFGMRKISDKYGFWVWLSPEWHNAADYGVHGKCGRELDLRLKRECQAEYERTHSHGEFMAIIGKNYLG